MPQVLLVANRPDAFEELAQALQDKGILDISWAHDEETALDKAAADKPALVIVDDYIGKATGLEWIQRLMGVNAFIQTAAVSSMTHETFHEASEGLGIMAQLPPRPGKEEAERILQMLKGLAGM